MDNPIHILHLEDRLTDSFLIESALKKEFPSYEYYLADNEKDFLEILAMKQVDVILSDFDLPGYSGSEALEIVKSQYPQVPFIFVSGVMGEDAAIESMQNGAVDYVLKSKIQRIGPAIRRALHEAELLRQKKSLEEEQRKLSRAVEQSPVSVIITDLKGNIEYVNPQTCEVSGYSREDLIGKNPRIFKSGELPASVYRILWETISSGKQWRGEFHNKRKNGTLYWEAVVISPVFDTMGKITHYIALKEDYTSRKRMIEELKAAKERAEASDRLKTAFIRNISHEVRTPLNGILGYGSLLAEPGLSQEERREYFALLKDSTDRLTETFTNYLDISMILSESLDVSITVFNAADLLDALEAEYRPSAHEKNLEWRMEIQGERDDLTIRSDPGLLRKVLSHLVSNALKFTETGEIIIDCGRNQSAIEFTVMDTGPGIDKVWQEKIFENFVQEDISLSRGHEGSGLGLSIVKGILKRLGCDIRIESEPGKGTAFFISIPGNPV